MRDFVLKINVFAESGFYILMFNEQVFDASRVENLPKETLLAAF